MLSRRGARSECSDLGRSGLPLLRHFLHIAALHNVGSYRIVFICAVMAVLCIFVYRCTYMYICIRRYVRLHARLHALCNDYIRWQVKSLVRSLWPTGHNCMTHSANLYSSVSFLQDIDLEQV